MKNKTILITGATSGIGYEVAKKLALNNQLLIIAKDKEKLENLQKLFPSIKKYIVDLSSTKEVEMICNMILKDYSKIDILINNAAVQFQDTFLDTQFKVDNISKEIDINFTSICILTYKLLPLFQKSHKAQILNINSGLAIVPKTSSAIYSATKAALDSLSKTLRNQFENENILVQQIFFELVNTSMSKNRGKNKISSSEAALEIIHVLENKILDYDVGKVKFLRFLNKFAPFLAKNIMKRS